MKKPVILFLISSILFFSSCDPNRVFEENKEIPEAGWDVKNKVSFKVMVDDTVSPVNFYVNVRNADGYPFSNIYLFILTTFPDGKQAKDTLECLLADETGKWLGEGLGDIWDNQILFKKGVRFPKAGNYQFEMEHAMRINPLPLIMDVGLRIEKQK